MQAQHLGNYQKIALQPDGPFQIVGLVEAALAAPGERAQLLFEEAIAAIDAERWPFDLAWIHLLYGERLRRARHIARSRMYLETAAEMFGRLDARIWADRAWTELRAAGHDRERGERRDAEALTSQELEIAKLAATGLTNKQIADRLHLAPRTVSAHLYRIFPKLGISSRAALRDALTRNSAG
jgi:DNA-binding CsgD family transcriptional regulator